MTFNTDNPGGIPYLGFNATNIPISNSEIVCFKENRREWWLKYYRGLTPRKKIVVGPLPLGTRVHYALEKMYGDGLDPTQAYFEQLAIDRELFYESPDAAEEAQAKKFESEAELGRLMVEGYLEWLADTNADDKYEIVGVEQEVAYPFIDGRVILRGKVDMKVRDLNDGARLAMDHKTALSFKPYYDLAAVNEQLKMYTLLEKLSNPDGTPVEGGIYNLLKKVKRSAKAAPPFYDRIVVRYNQETLNNFWTRLHGTLYDMIRVRDALDAGADPNLVAYPTISNDLTWKSDFLPVYHMLDDGSDAERWLRDHTELHDPYARYDREDEG